MPILFHPPAIHRSAEDLQADIIHPGDMTAEQLAAWADMRRAQPDFQSPLLSPDFALTMGRNRADTRIAIFRRNEQVVGFLPFHARPDGCARPLGAPFSDLHALITPPGADVDPQAAFKAAGISGYRFDGLIDPFAMFRNETRETANSYVLKVDRAPDAVLAQLTARSPARFKQFRRKERKLEREIGPLEITIGDSDPAAFTQLLAWKRAQYKRTGLHDVLAPAWVQAMMDDLFRQRAGPLQGCMVTLRAGGRLAAADFGLREQSAFHPWISAYDPHLSQYSPGMLLLVRAIAAMPPAGLETYDLGPSPESYKPYFASETRPVAAGAIGGKGSGLRRLVQFLPDGRWRNLVNRVARRMDHVASVELTALGRVHGAWRAMISIPARVNGKASASAADDQLA